MERQITWQEIDEQIASVLGERHYTRFYGVPRGGMYIAARMKNPVDTPEEADVIIDDLIDSGATRCKYQILYPGKPFIGLFDKADPEYKGKWLRFPWENKGDIDVEHHMQRVIQNFDDGNREGLKETPKRYIKFLREFMDVPEFKFTTFDAEGMDQMIVQTEIPFYSLCEHHLAPFFGVAHVGYIPKDKIVGLSKLARCVDLYARKFQNQERITSQVADRIAEELAPSGVAVVLKAQHLCMTMRGVNKPGTWTTTSKMLGAFKDDLNCRNEFLKLINNK